MLLNGVCQAAAGSYLQTAVVAVAARLGAPALQAVMSGQAAVAVAISGVQLLSALASVRARSSDADAGANVNAGAADASRVQHQAMKTMYAIPAPLTCNIFEADALSKS